MGYASYTALRYKLASELRQQVTEPSNETNLQQIIGVANTLKSSPVVYLYSRGASIVSVSYLSRFLSLANVPHLVITDIHQLTRAELGTLLLISKSGETNAVIEMAQNAKRKGLKVLGISHNGSTLDQVCHLNVALEEQVDGISLYGRESQIHTLQIIDQIGKELLTF